jgi:hypothetical protein
LHFRKRMMIRQQQKATFLATLSRVRLSKSATFFDRFAGPPPRRGFERCLRRWL